MCTDHEPARHRHAARDVPRTVIGNRSAVEAERVARCELLRAMVPADHAIEDLRMMIGAGEQLARLLPTAIERLAQNVLAEGDLYPGDLLCTVLRVDWAVVDERVAHQAELRALVACAEADTDRGDGEGPDGDFATEERRMVLLEAERLMSLWAAHAV